MQKKLLLLTSKFIKDQIFDPISWTEKSPDVFINFKYNGDNYSQD